MRSAALLAVFGALLAAVPAAAASPHHAKPKIKAEEVGYFGSGLSTRHVVVIVYSNLGPRAGNHVMVCLKDGRCKKAVGHHAPAHSTLAWYSATFSTPMLTMQDHLTFTAVAADAAGRSTVTVTKPVLCIKGAGSTPQS